LITMNASANVASKAINARLIALDDARTTRTRGL
jgi:hypothetical protein